MRIVVVSDTHAQHEELGIVTADVLIHCGDGCDGFRRDPADVDRLDEWFSRQRVALVLAIGGNHDFEMERRSRAALPVFSHAVYLEDRCHEHQGCRFYGAPWTPELIGWAFFQDGKTMREKWASVPSDIDVLITHTAPYGILDRNRRGVSLGCRDLLNRLPAIRPRLHVFGHNHASAGAARIGPTLHVNASMVNSRYAISHKPIEIDLDASTRSPATLIGSALQVGHKEICDPEQ
jgi:Icc-related predicted phosphoesterase